MRWRVLTALVITGILAQSTDAQDTATPTATSTPTVTATRTPPPTPPRPFGAELAPLSATLLACVQATGAGPAIWVGHWPHTAIQVAIPTGTCSNLDVQMLGLIGGTIWSPIPLDEATSITEADIPVGESRIWALPPGLRYVQADVTAISSCTVCVYLAGNP